MTELPTRTRAGRPIYRALRLRDHELVRDYFNQVKATAHKMGKMSELRDRLRYLNEYAQHEGCLLEGREVRCWLGIDFAPLSFGFYMEVREEDGRWRRWMVGGLIYSGPGLPTDGSFPVLTVSEPYDGWEVHT